MSKLSQPHHLDALRFRIITQIAEILENQTRIQRCAISSSELNHNVHQEIVSELQAAAAICDPVAMTLAITQSIDTCVRLDHSLDLLFQYGREKWAAIDQHIHNIMMEFNQTLLELPSILIEKKLLERQSQVLQNTLDKLHEAQEQLVQSEKMSTVGQLAAGVAHEINNPIGYINSNLTSLKNYVDDMLALLAIYEKVEATCTHSEQLAEISAFKQKIDLAFLKTDVLDLLNESYEGTTRVKKIVQYLKDFSHHGGDDEWQWALLNTGLERTLNMVNYDLTYKAKVVKEFGNLPEIRCLPYQLNQVFMNLLVNAAQAIDSEGIITLRTGTKNDHVWVEISDTGKGIAPEHISKIFDPFFTTKPVGKGTGLGLSISYSIIKKHEGQIQVNSQLGQGTTFKIILPITGPVPADA